MRMVFEDGERAALIAQLGLAEDANDEALGAAMAERLRSTPQETEEERLAREQREADALAGISDDDDIVVVDVEEFRRLRSRDRVAGEVERTLAVRDRDELIEEAIHDGKISPSRREHYQKKYESDPEGTKKLIGVLKKNTVPVEVRGKDAPTDEVDESAYDQSWVPEVAARQAAQQDTGRDRNRVHGES